MTTLARQASHRRWGVALVGFRAQAVATGASSNASEFGVIRLGLHSLLYTLIILI